MDFLGNQTRMNFPGNRMGMDFLGNQTGVVGFLLGFSRKSNEDEFSRKSNGGWIFLGIKRGFFKEKTQ